MKLFQRLAAATRYVNPNGTFTQAFIVAWQRFCEKLEEVIGSIQEALDAIEAAVLAIQNAQTAADNANDAAEAAQTAADNAASATAASAAEASLNKSYVANFVSPVISADSLGAVTIADHDRVYGNSALNPTVTVTGGVLATGLAHPSILYVYYIQPSRAGGVVTYLWSLDEAEAAQVGDTHSVGSVQIPTAGTSSGGYVRPVGIASWKDVPDY